MTTRQKIELRLSEVRSRLNEIAGLEGDGRTEESGPSRQPSRPSSASWKRASRPQRWRDPTIEVSTEDAEGRELRQLTDDANIGAILTASLEHRQTDGREAELQTHFKVAGNQIPLELLRVDRAVEGRAAATVPASIGDASQAEVITPIFATGDGAFLGIERPVVGIGVAAHPVLSTLPTVAGPFSDSSEVTQTDATFVANTLAPERLSASFSYRHSDAARFSGLDASLRLALNSGLQEALDDQAISGTDGLLTSTNLPNANVNAVSTFALYLSNLLYARVDGRLLVRRNSCVCWLDRARLPTLRARFAETTATNPPLSGWAERRAA